MSNKNMVSKVCIVFKSLPWFNYRSTLHKFPLYLCYGWNLRESLLLGSSQEPRLGDPCTALGSFGSLGAENMTIHYLPSQLMIISDRNKITQNTNKVSIIFSVLNKTMLIEGCRSKFDLSKLNQKLIGNELEDWTPMPRWGIFFITSWDSSHYVPRECGSRCSLRHTERELRAQAPMGSRWHVCCQDDFGLS